MPASKVSVGDYIINSLHYPKELTGNVITGVTLSLQTLGSKRLLAITTATETFSILEDACVLQGTNDQNIDTWVVGQ